MQIKTRFDEIEKRETVGDLGVLEIEIISIISIVMDKSDSCLTPTQPLKFKRN